MTSSRACLSCANSAPPRAGDSGVLACAHVHHAGLRAACLHVLCLQPCPRVVTTQLSCSVMRATLCSQCTLHPNICTRSRDPVPFVQDPASDMSICVTLQGEGCWLLQQGSLCHSTGPCGSALHCSSIYSILCHHILHARVGVQCRYADCTSDTSLTHLSRSNTVCKPTRLAG